jgi:CubicO group peptidase (beta-lactamase class C family)
MAYDNYFDQIKRSMPLILQEYKIPGMSIIVVNNDSTLFAEGFGHTSLSKTYSITADTAFGVQSVSKTYTAFGFMKAVESGRVQLNDALIKYLPDFSVKSRDGNDYSSLITFKQLLQHQSGLREFPIGNYIGRKEPDTERIKSIYNTYLKFIPGSSYSYTNAGFDIIAYVLGLIFDMPFYEYMKKYVFEPLEMLNSTFDYNNVLLDYKSAIGHNKGIPLVKFPENPYGSGGMYSSVNDMGKFISCFLDGGRFRNNKVVGSDTLRKLYSEYTANNEWKYHLGVDVGFVNNKLCVNHNGRGYGFQTIQDIYPENNLGIVVLTNSANHPFIHHQICRHIAADLFAMQYEGENDCCQLADCSLNNYIGIYQLDDYILADDDNIRAAIIPRYGKLFYKNMELTQFDDTTFFTGNNDIVEFFKDSARINHILFTKVMQY